MKSIAKKSIGGMKTPIAKKPAKRGKVEYRAKDGARINDHDAVILGRFCERLLGEHGSITAETFVKHAERDTTVRGYLTWDNSEAARQWRLVEARELIRSLVVTVERHDRTTQVRGLMFVDSEGAYVPSSRVLADDDMRDEVLAKARREAVSWFHRYQHLRSVDEVSPVFDAIEKLLNEELGAKNAAE